MWVLFLSHTRVCAWHVWCRGIHAQPDACRRPAIGPSAIRCEMPQRPVGLSAATSAASPRRHGGYKAVRVMPADGFMRDGSGPRGESRAEGRACGGAAPGAAPGAPRGETRGEARPLRPDWPRLRHSCPRAGCSQSEASFVSSGGFTQGFGGMLPVYSDRNPGVMSRRNAHCSLRSVWYSATSPC